MQAGSTPTSTDSALLAELALSRGDLVQEWGYDDDVDVTFRDALEDALGEELLTEEDQEPADAVLFWWRADDGDVMDLADALVDAQRSLDAGPVWIMTPRKGRPGHVSPADVAEAASTAGLHATTGAGASEDWAAQKLVQKRGG
ncbi:DUF3052 domain-containing protein [Micrococcus luteus]|uniref:DUF3052 domain-containing protein n=1 Tax=Micrococcus luteus TaxID=1270 RepID=A0ABD7M5B8_MICLU|nr:MULTISPECIES: DUF3052 domain-containing protein [Micrococcus]AWD24266.1 DUF3052 domain-containing protein [Micrococcus luteus]MCT1816514.1 DUF3052 domain-containing protein [Micrococcus luteus]MCV7515762.1 DUF3052 domain-containing protein [Micrococcus luteus]MCV7562124.1 DUF3052 domain-containing protein [Micrococcus luteus]MCV7570731.1 DUF3052 domain-containing protein [Micrococcus luteus]